MVEVPCLRIEHLSAAQKLAYVLADNKLALNAGWDEDLLADELKQFLGTDLGFDLSVTGFEIAEIDTLVDGLKPQEDGDPRDDALPPLAQSSRCRPGDIWPLGPHRLACGSALDRATAS